MPTYSYRCPECGHEYTKLQKMTDRTRARCPVCSARGERQITGGGGLHFKGSGFYITDYKRAAKQPASETGEDGKPAPKPDAATAESKTPSTPKPKGADS